MERPKKQIERIIHVLTEGSPAEQKDTLDSYFLRDASFSHPLCHVPSFKHFSIPYFQDVNSRWVIWMIYRWNKIISPRTVLNVECDEFNQKSQILFIEIQQIFSIFFIPYHSSNVRLTTKLHLHRDSETGKYYVKRQEDLYQLTEVVKFFIPGGAAFIGFWQMIATMVCIVGAILFAPQEWKRKKPTNGVAPEELLE